MFLLKVWNIHRGQSFSTVELEMKRQENKKVTKLIVVVTVTFVLCVLPYHAIGKTTSQRGKLDSDLCCGYFHMILKNQFLHWFISQ